MIIERKAEGILQAGDILISVTVNGKTSEITRQYHIVDILLDVRVGDTLNIKVSRDGQEISVSATITEKCLTEY